MTLAAALLALMQLVVPSAQGLSLDQRVELLADFEATNRYRLETAIFEDPEMRAEIRRVGFARGCGAVDEASRSVAPRHAEALRPYAAQAIRTVIPAQYLQQARVVTFLVMPLSMYSARVEARIAQLAAEPLGVARRDMRAAFVRIASALPTSTQPQDNIVMPRADIAAALGQNGPWDLDNMAQLHFACSDARISPAIRPTFTTGPQPGEQPQ